MGSLSLSPPLFICGPLFFLSPVGAVEVPGHLKLMPYLMVRTPSFGTFLTAGVSRVISTT